MAHERENRMTIPGEDEPHPALGPLCPRCGVPAGVSDHHGLCRSFQDRRELWANGWADVTAFGLPPEAATGWREVRLGTAARVMHGGFGPEQVIPWEGPWVRHRDRTCSAHRRLAAIFVRHGATDDRQLLEVASQVVRAGGATVERWLRPEALAIDTTACGRAHQVVIRRGVAVDVDHRRSESRRVDHTIPRFTSPLTCEELVRRWEAADFGEVRGDISADPTPTYERVGGDPALTAAGEMLRRACLARARCDLVEAGEPDRWLDLDAVAAPTGSPALLYPSTRPLPIALVSAPLTWPWSPEPLA